MYVHLNQDMAGEWFEQARRWVQYCFILNDQEYNEKQFVFLFPGNGGELTWCFSQVKGSIEEDVAEGKYRFIKPLSAKKLAYNDA